MSDNINRKLFYAAQLFNAASGGRYDEVAACISRGADPAWTHRDCWSALHQAAQHGHVQVARLLLDHGWHTEGRSETRPLHWAAIGGHVEVIQLLAERGAEINSQDSYEDTPLHNAADNGRTAAVQSLLSLGADATIKNNEGCRPLHYAAAEGHVEVIQLLAEWQRQLGSAPRLPLQHQAALHGPGPEEIEMARSFWTRWQEFLDSQDNNGDTPLHLASKWSHQDAVEALIWLGADTTIKNGEGKTAKEAEGEEDST